MQKWSYIADGLKIEVQYYTKLNFGAKIDGLIIKMVLKEKVAK